jgi:hypothetical protein
LDDEEGDESGKIELGLEADLELAHERQGDTETSEVTFDEVGITLEGNWWQLVTGVKYESASKDILLEEAVARLGGTEDLPWFFQIGRTVLPFGEFSSQFIEDPLGTVIGETDEVALVFGCENDGFEAAFGIYRGERGARDGINVVTSVRIMACRNIDIGIDFSNDLGESAELQEISHDLAEKSGSGEASGEDVAGFAGLLMIGVEPLQISLEYLTPLKSFGAGFLDEDPRKPSAWNAEIAVQPFDSWEIALRVESAHELPENPKWQYGVSASCELNENIGLAAEYLYGEYESEDNDRHLVSSALTMEY